MSSSGYNTYRVVYKNKQLRYWQFVSWMPGLQAECGIKGVSAAAIMATVAVVFYC